MSKTIKGSCCCGKVTFNVKDCFTKFYFCHCEQCRKLTGSAHASNLFTTPENIEWLSGEKYIKKYAHQTRTFSNAFCQNCGSGLPFKTQSGQFLIVPAGSLNQEPSKPLDAQIFCREETDWHKSGVDVEKAPAFL